jgi:hypothetical protein
MGKILTKNYEKNVFPDFVPDDFSICVYVWFVGCVWCVGRAIVLLVVLPCGGSGGKRSDS